MLRTNTKILLVEADRSSRETLEGILEKGQFPSITVGRKSEALAVMGKVDLRVVVVGTTDPRDGGPIALCQELRECDPELAIVVVTADSSTANAVAALRAGVLDYFLQPLAERQFLASVGRLLTREMRRRAPDAGRKVPATPHTPFVGGSEKIRAVRRYLVRVAATDITVLITGETGTGKDRIARLIHRHSRRRKRPFASINCAAVPESLLESELFGFEKGAFTGAESRFSGKLLMADGGTVLLDEIGEMSVGAQAKILRVIEDKEVTGLRSTTSRQLDVRFITATNQDLETAVAEGRFRKDLYYRLNAARIELPSLADNRADIPVLIDYYLNELRARYDRAALVISPAAIDRMVAHDWPGNVRQLKNTLETAVATCDADEIGVDDLPPCLDRRDRPPAAAAPGPDDRGELLRTLSASQWNKTEAAKRLNCSRMTIYRKMPKYGIAPNGDGSESLHE